MERSLPSTFLLIALAVAACGRRVAKEDTQKPAATRVKPDTLVVTERNAPETLEITGTLAADKRTDLAANAVGRVLRTFVERGDHVTAGAILAQLDARAAALTRRRPRPTRPRCRSSSRTSAPSARATMCCSKRARSRARSTTGRARSAGLKRRGKKPRVPALQKRHERSATRTSVRPTRRSSPSASCSVGDYVQADSKVVTLLAIDSLRLRLSVPERAIASVHEGTVVSFETVSLPSRDLHRYG